uniref:Coiled-coil domain-containing protein n=1 Tax=Astyanax mexicanus TaxID=7994 RepID=A0A8B9H0A4_ASTMX
MEEQDCEYAKMIQEELRRRDEEARRREEEDEELAKRLQEEEELEMKQQRAEAGQPADTTHSPLSEELWAQLVRDAELARTLQEEEDGQPDRKSRGSDVDFRAAQVAQDEEIARYMQRQERKNSRSRRSQDLEVQERSLEVIRKDADNTTSRKMEPLQMPRERLNSEGLHSPVEEEHTLEQHHLSPTCNTLLVIHSHSLTYTHNPIYTRNTDVFYSKCLIIFFTGEHSQSVTSQRSWTQLSPPERETARYPPAHHQEYAWHHGPLTVFSMITCLNPHSSRPPDAMLTNWCGPKPKRNERTASNSNWNI